jgi:hypothetical protein
MRRKSFGNPDKEALFMQILIASVIQFAECSEEEALHFVLGILDKMDNAGVAIR